MNCERCGRGTFGRLCAVCKGERPERLRTLAPATSNGAPLELTRALLEHYLRATGWESDGTDQVHRTRGLRYSPDEVEDLGDLEEITGESDTAFRLGLCAAAERCLFHARELGLANVVVGHGVLFSQAAELLSAAGIELAAWERARQKGAGDGDS